jgi:ribonuclease T1
LNTGRWLSVRFYFLLCLALGLAAAVAPISARETTRPAILNVHLADLPNEARATLALIKVGVPFPYPRDGVVFGNFERRLPVRERGYYREYTVPTPGARDRGARRLIAGRNGEYYYTDDHYRTFRRIRE